MALKRKKSNCLKKRRRQVIETILVDTEDVWGKIFQENNMEYKDQNGLFSQSVKTECGSATAASGPLFPC
jgi:predicted metalloprotease